MFKLRCEKNCSYAQDWGFPPFRGIPCESLCNFLLTWTLAFLAEPQVDCLEITKQKRLTASLFASKNLREIEMQKHLTETV